MVAATIYSLSSSFFRRIQSCPFDSIGKTVKTFMAKLFLTKWNSIRFSTKVHVLKDFFQIFLFT